jgi:hypothetical protein
VSNGVEFDTSDLDKGLRQLTRGVDRGIGPAAQRSANAVAKQLRPLIPVRTGRLRRTVTVTKDGDSATVHYGGTLPYARYIDGRTGATEQATQNAPDDFYREMHELGAKEVQRL